MSSDPRDDSTWRLSTVGGIPYRFLGFEGELGVTDGTATGSYLVKSSNFLAFVSEALPNLVDIGGNLILDGGFVVAGFPQLRAHSLRYAGFIEGKPIDLFNFDPNAATGTYGDLVKVDIEFKTTKQDENDPFSFLEISSTGSGEFLNTTGPGNVEPGPNDPSSDANGQPIPRDLKNPAAAPIVVTVPEVEWTIKWPRMPFTVFKNRIIERLRESLGKVNTDTFAPLFDAPPETLFFEGWSYTESYSWRAFGNVRPLPGQQLLAAVGPGQTINNPITLEMKFKEKNINDNGTIVGHNHSWVPGKGWRRTWLNKAGTLPMYRGISFINIFRPLS